MKYMKPITTTVTRCEDIKRIIDEADRPEALPLEATDHLETCSRSSSFADERTRLRSLLASSPRVSVPANFSAVLNERLAATRRRPLTGWIGQYAFMKFSAAAACVAVLVFVVQYSGVFSNLNKKTVEQVASQSTRTPSETEPTVLPPASSYAAALTTPLGGRVSTLPRNKQTYRVSKPSRPIDTPDESDFNDGGALLVRMPNSDRDIIVPTVNVGAQPLVYSNAGRSAPR